MFLIFSVDLEPFSMQIEIVKPIALLFSARRIAGRLQSSCYYSIYVGFTILFYLLNNFCVNSTKEDFVAKFIA